MLVHGAVHAYLRGADCPVRPREHLKAPIRLRPRHRDARTQEIHNGHRHPGLILRSAKPLATRQQREHEWTTQTVPTQGREHLGLLAGSAQRDCATIKREAAQNARRQHAMPFAAPSTERIANLRQEPGYRRRLSRFTAPTDMSGHPTLTFPAGVTATDRPVAAQLVSGHLNEGLLVRAGGAFQAATNWHLRRPPVDALGTER